VSVDFQDEELMVSEAVGLAIHGFDFVVGAFQRSGGNGVVVVGKETVGVKTERSGELVKDANVARFRAENPIQEECLGLLRHET